MGEERKTNVRKEVSDIKKGLVPGFDPETFLADSYRTQRKSGRTMEEIAKDYDSCHVWR